MTTVSHKNSKSWIKEESNENEIIDLLSSNMSKNILHRNPEKNTKSKTESFEITSDGKLVIKDLDNPNKNVKRKRDDELDPQLPDSEPEEEAMSTKQSVRSSKSVQSSYKTGGKGIHRDVNREPGEEYRSNKAKGDMKRKGRPDPYAYIPLNRQYLNKRKKAKMSGQFNNLIKAARKGAQRGASTSASNARKRRKN